ncbi:hypothetical protein ENHY17A_100292 [Moraxellaceae bacterium 17A]|nr:hypothetical protein ENHY17A_100292 [Moraxellaceae bacterium 17A]
MVNLPVLLIIDENFNTAIEKGKPADHEIISQTVFIKSHKHHVCCGNNLICLPNRTN